MVELPFERELHARLVPRNARIVGVYTDSDFDHYRSAVEHYPVPWRNVWDGPGKLRAGPLCTELGVNGVPFTVVLDRRGVIRAVGARGKGLEQALEDVLASKDAGERK